MGQCYYCGLETDNLVQCPLCKQYYCAVHEAPEMHDCPRTPIVNPYEMNPAGGNTLASMDELMYGTPNDTITGDVPPPSFSVTQSPYRSEEKEEEEETYVYTDGTYIWYRKGKPEEGEPDYFDPASGVVIPGVLWPKLSEFWHVVIASILMFSLAATGILSTPQITELPPDELVVTVVFLSAMYLAAFLTHEFSHRQTAVHFKMQTKFRLFTFGVIMTVICLFLPIKMALPGAVVVIGLEKVSRETGLCKLAGPLSNLILGSVLMILAFVPFILYPYNYLLLQAAGFNYMLGAFNLLPIGILDGDNIRKWNPKVWIIMFVTMVGLFILNQMLVSNINIFTEFYLRGRYDQYISP